MLLYLYLSWGVCIYFVFNRWRRINPHTKNASVEMDPKIGCLRQRAASTIQSYEHF